MTFRERFEAKVSPEPMSGCHLWAGAVKAGGYGSIRSGREIQLAHRVAWELAHGSIPGGSQVLHHCDVPTCVNVEHLFLGSHADNMADKIKKGRGRNPRADAFARLTHCLRGHPYSGENLVIHANGGRRCRACEQKRDRMRRPANGGPATVEAVASRSP